MEWPQSPADAAHAGSTIIAICASAVLYLQHASILLLGDEERVRPLIIQKLQLPLLLLREALSWRQVTLTPCGDCQMPTCV